MIDPDTALLFLDFVEERHHIWEARQRGEAQPWTADPVLASRKFTNVFRILDPGSQFVLTDLAADSPAPRDLLMRLFLYRHTGRVEVWKYLQAQMGGYPTVEDLDDVLEVFKEYRGGGTSVSRGDNPSRNAAGATWTKFDRPVFTSAYLVFPQSAEKGTDKLESIINLTARLFCPDRFPGQEIWEDWKAASSQAERFAVLRRNKGVADFMSMQILTDWGYVAGGNEDEFVVSGPGATKGAKLIDPKAKAGDIIKWAVKSIHDSYKCPELFIRDEHRVEEYRQPSSMDVQNCLCEFSKYVRYLNQPPRAVKPYVPAHPGPQPHPVLPKHW